MNSLGHTIILAIIILLLYFLYDEGLGAIPFLLAAIYLGIIVIKELKNLRRSKRL